MNKLKEKQKRIHHLRRRFLETANRLIEVNEAKMSSRSALLLCAIRQCDWVQASEHCATLEWLLDSELPQLTQGDCVGCREH
jgi:hypothetical protein